MTLLPIIYTSLMIFSAFLLFVIIVSYISYKMKGGKNQLRRFNQAGPQPIIISAPIRRIPSVPVTPKVIFPEYASTTNMNHRNTSLQRNSEIKKQFAISEIKHPEQNRKNVVSHRNSFERLSRTQNHTRLEIMNTSEKYNQQPATIEFPIRHVRTSQSLTDANILNYYSDRSDNGFVSLRAV